MNRVGWQINEILWDAYEHNKAPNWRMLKWYRAPLGTLDQHNNRIDQP